MAEPIIRIENLGKRYQIGITQDTLGLRDSFTSIFDVSRLFRRSKQDFWALRDLTCDIAPGQAVGIIGRNGAGKSTLLKLLSQITPPTTGRIQLGGRVASLLEVGTGFHLELTGRENIYLNGAILGMTRREIKKNFDAIVEFSEVEKFLDTPVKHYSSGMYVRLAFSIAAHLESEVLIIDEVLAVGDRRFQQKCLGKMEEVGKQGRTVIFVSHNMALIRELCPQALLLEKGQLIQYGNTESVIETYLARDETKTAASLDLTKRYPFRNTLPSSRFTFTQLTLKDQYDKPTTSIGLGEPFYVEVCGTFKAPVPDLTLGLTVNSSLGFPIFSSYTNSHDGINQIKSGLHRFSLAIDPNILSPGMYTLGLTANGAGVIDWIPDILTFNVEAFDTTNQQSLHPNYDGVIVYPSQWQMQTATKRKKKS